MHIKLLERTRGESGRAEERQLVHGKFKIGFGAGTA